MIKKIPNSAKIIEFNNLKKFNDNEKNQTSVLVGGCFDILHYGHLYFLKKTKEFGDILIVALESDEFILYNKKRHPIHTQAQRAEMLCSLEFVDVVVKLPFFTKDEDYFNMVKLINPNIIALTKGDPQLSNKSKQADMIGAKIILCPLIKNLSSSKIINGAAISST